MCPMCLRHAMSGIDTGYAATKGLIASGELGSGQVPPYAMSGTEIWYRLIPAYGRAT